MKVSHSVVSEYMNYARLPGKDTSSPNCQKGCVLSRCLFFVGKMLLFIEYGDNL